LGAANERMKETETAHSLLEEIATLSSRGGSGRLQIRAGATRGAFFFKQGKLVDARMGPFTGFLAINLAVSMGETRLSFDPSIQPPPSRFKDFSERTLLKERFGIDTFDSEVAGNQPRIAEEREHIFDATVQGECREATFPRKQASAAEKDVTAATTESIKPGREVFSSGETNQCLTQAGPVTSITKPQQTQKTPALSYLTPRNRLKRLLTYDSRERVVLRIGFIMLVVIPAAVVTASYWTDGEQTSGLRPSHSLRAEPLLTPTPSQDAAVIPFIKTVRGEPLKPTRYAQVAVNKDLKTVPLENVKTLPLEVPDRKTQDIKNVPTDDMAMEHNLSDKPSTRTVVVVVQIAEGHVTEAYVQNPQAGMGAYESTALRMARERRYPKDTKRKETVVLKVTERKKM
jgi:hypothetical protein